MVVFGTKMQSGSFARFERIVVDFLLNTRSSGVPWRVVVYQVNKIKFDSF